LPNTRRGSKGSRRFPEITGKHESATQADQGLRLAGRQRELDLKAIGRMEVDHRAEFAAAQAVLGRSRSKTTVLCLFACAILPRRDSAGVSLGRGS
jgi:hypothetical protein